MEKDDDEKGLLMHQAIANNRRHHAGRSKGQSNFKIDEDFKLASARSLVGTNVPTRQLARRTNTAAHPARFVRIS
jgi:hypothetical protein